MKIYNLQGKEILKVPGDTLRWADLRRTDLQEANLRGADLQGADLSWANLREANLFGADLHGAYLQGADLYKVNLQAANLQGANLYMAYLQGADLYMANLQKANLQEVDLREANLTNTKFIPTNILQAQWGVLSDKLTLKLMRLDSSAHPKPELFNIWAEGGKCPYSNINVFRIVNFKEKRELWSPGSPPTIWEAIEMILKEKCPNTKL